MSVERPPSSLLPTQPYKGMRDFLPEEMSVRTRIFQTMFEVVERYGYQRYEGPVLEPTAIYEAKSGDEIVREQLFRLQDKAGRELALRPEMTPTVARMIAANANRITFPARWYSHASCYRYERPQRGRTREHWQLNVDVFGSESYEAEIEIFDLIGSIMRAFGASSDIYTVRVNDRILVEGALTGYVGVAPEAVQRVCSVIDRWEKVTEDVRHDQLVQLGLSRDQIERLETLSDASFDTYCELAGDEASSRSRLPAILREGAGATPLAFDPMIIRGLTYYTSTVFEVFDVSKDNRRSIFGGGRYDDLAALFSKQRIPGIGFGMGDVTTWNFLESHDLLPNADIAPDVFVFAASETHQGKARDLARALRAEGMRVVQSFDVAGLKHGLKHADRIGARCIVALDEREMAEGHVLVKDLRSSQQWAVAPAEVSAVLARAL